MSSIFFIISSTEGNKKGAGEEQERSKREILYVMCISR
jgi:hypothetical protein